MQVVPSPTALSLIGLIAKVLRAVASSLLLLSCSALAHAEDSISTDPNVPDDTTHSLVSSEASILEIDEIVVTAQKRKERLQDVPISVSVISGEKLKRRGLSGFTEFSESYSQIWCMGA